MSPDPAAAALRPLNIVVCAFRAGGGTMLGDWLFDTAVRAGHSAQCGSLPRAERDAGNGVFCVEIGPVPDAALQGRQVVFSQDMALDGVDLLLSGDLLETLRQVAAGRVSPERTWVLSATARELALRDRRAATDQRTNSAAVLATLAHHARATELLDLSEMARQADTVASAVVLGAVAASGVLPFERRAYEDTIRASAKGDNAIRANLKGFSLAFDTVTRRRQQRLWLDSEPRTLPRDLPVPSRAPDLRARARLRLAEYQDSAYARLYDERLSRVAQAEAVADPEGLERGAITEETTRWLALWMAFEDMARVAALKLRASRRRRSQDEPVARSDQVDQLMQHFKPGVPEFAALMPQRMAQRFIGWDRRRLARGEDAWVLPMPLGTQTLLGALVLRVMASLKTLRRRSSRYALEQQLITQWLQAIEQGAREHWALGHELALCGRLIKGHGRAHERGKQCLLHIIHHLARPAPGRLAAAGARAAAVHAARVAALSDGGGAAFDQALREHGAPARALPLQARRRDRRQTDQGPGLRGERRRRA